MATAETYERSYKSMWDEIARARRERDQARGLADAARDLVLALDHDLQSGETKVSVRAHDAFNRLASRLDDFVK